MFEALRVYEVYFLLSGVLAGLAAPAMLLASCAKAAKVADRVQREERR